MNKESLAAILNGREYGEEISGAEGKEAKQHGLLVIFGYSDDNVELRGAVDEEIGAYEDATFHLHSGGLLEPANQDCAVCMNRTKQDQKKCAQVEAVWGKNGYSWSYKTGIPHATFDIMEGEDKFCRGIVIDIKDLPSIA